MSNELVNLHFSFGAPCGETADWSQIMEWAAGVIEDNRMCDFQEGIPEKDGWYLVELLPGLESTQPMDVDYCRDKSHSDGDGRQWTKYYAHNIKSWSVLP